MKKKPISFLHNQKYYRVKLKMYKRLLGQALMQTKLYHAHTEGGRGEKKRWGETAYTWVYTYIHYWIIFFTTKFPNETKKWSIPPTKISLPLFFDLPSSQSHPRYKVQERSRYYISRAINILQEEEEGQCWKNSLYQLVDFLSLFSARLAVLFCGSRTRACWKSA